MLNVFAAVQYDVQVVAVTLVLQVNTVPVRLNAGGVAWAETVNAAVVGLPRLQGSLAQIGSAVAQRRTGPVQVEQQEPTAGEQGRKRRGAPLEAEGGSVGED